jgi:hypothetical protein
VAGGEGAHAGDQDHPGVGVAGDPLAEGFGRAGILVDLQPEGPGAGADRAPVSRRRISYFPVKRSMVWQDW